MPFLLGTDISEVLKLTWILPFLSCIFSKYRSIIPQASWSFIIFILFFASYCLLCEGITGHEYLGSDFRNIIISFGVFLVSYLVWTKNRSQEFLNQIIFVSLFCTAIVGGEIYVEFLSSYALDEYLYAYNSKNSISQILLNSIILFTCLKIRNKTFLVIGLVISAMLILEIFLLKSRATIVGLAFALIYFLFYTKDKKIKLYLRVAVAVVMIYIYYNSYLFDTLVDNIIIANRDSDDLNNISSGRIVLIEEAWNLFVKSPIIGVGNFYTDCFPVVILAQYGLIGGTIVFTFLLNIYYKILRVRRMHTMLVSAAFLLYTTILLNSLFEAQPPFGPGMKCFTVWMVIGFAFSEYYERSDKTIRIKQ